MCKPPDDINKRWHIESQCVEIHCSIVQQTHYCSVCDEILLHRSFCFHIFVLGLIYMSAHGGERVYDIPRMYSHPLRCI